jgi:hypothetical protein
VTRAAQQPATRLRAGAAWIALLVLLGVGHIAPALHVLLVAHRLCAEHGEFVDATAESAPAPRTLPDSTSSIQAAEGAAHTHEHCGVLGFWRVLGAPAAPRQFASLLPVARVASVAAEARAAHVDIALLLYAPKLAPPSGAALPGAALPPST